MKKSTCIAALMAAGLGVAAVTGVALAMSAGRPPVDNQPGRERHACFDPAHVRSFQTVNDHKMIIVSDWNEAYELELGPACIGLDSSFQIGIRSRTGMSDVCGPFDAEIVYSDMGRDRLQSCPVTGMRHLVGDEAAPYIYKKKSERTN